MPVQCRRSAAAPTSQTPTTKRYRSLVGYCNDAHGSSYTNHVHGTTTNHEGGDLHARKGVTTANLAVNDQSGSVQEVPQ